MIQFTQYLRPDGRKTQVTTDPKDPEIQRMADEVIDAGGRFEIEILLNGMVSMTVAHDEEDIAIEICVNGPEIHKALHALVRNAHKEIGR